MKLTDIVEAHGNKENQTLFKTPPAGGTGENITTSQAARLLGVSASRVRQYIRDGELKALPPEKGRRDNLVKLSAVKRLAKTKRRIPGRVPKNNKG